jgi:looped-hinge helix DNA binding domain, AbrB family
MKKELERFLGTTKVGPKGQIVIPKEIRDMFGIESGDDLLIMADRDRGIAIHKQEVMEKLAKAIFEGQGNIASTQEKPEDLAKFAKAINEAIETGRAAE